MSRLHIILVFLLCIICGSIDGWSQDSTLVTNNDVLSGGISLKALATQGQVAQNRPVDFILSLEWSGDLDRYEIHPFDNPILQNFEIAGSGSSNRVTSANGQKRAIREYIFTLKPQALGMGYVEGMIIKYTDLETNTEYRLTSNRVSIKVIDPIPEPGAKMWIVWILLLFVLGIASFYIYNFLKRKKKNELLKAQEAAAAAVPLEEKYLSELKKSIDLDEPALDCVKAFSSMSKLLRHFLKEKFLSPGLEATTEDIVKFLKDQNFRDDFVNTVKEILSNADIIKFSGKQVDRNDVERTFMLVEAIFQKCLRNEITKNTSSIDNL